MKYTLSKVGEIVRVKRTLCGHSLADVAVAIGCSASLLSAIEIGKKAPTTDLALKMSAYFGMNADESRQLVMASIEDAAAFKKSLDDDLDKRLSALLAVFTNLATDMEKEEMATRLDEKLNERLKLVA